MSPTKKKVESLTANQQERMAEWRDRWTAIGLSTEPANRAEAERGVIIAYEKAKLPAPRIVWCGSPLSQGLTRAVVQNASRILREQRTTSSSANGKSVEKTLAGASVGDSVWDSVGDSVGDSVWDSVGDSVRDSVRASVWASVGDSVRDSVWDSVRDSVRDSGYGQHDANWLAFYDYFREVCGLAEETSKLEGLWLLCKNAGWFLPHEKICWISERHSVLNRDERGRLHCENGPALQYPDGFAIYAWHGVRVTYRVIEHPLDLTVAEIQNETNQEVRRVMIERYGLSRYLLDSGAQKIHEDELGELYRSEIPGDEPLVMVKVMNSTPEPDGSIKPYFLRVPPQITMARQAVAWTFGYDKAEDYVLAQQT